MIETALSRLCDKLPILSRIGEGDPLVSHLTYDSRHIQQGSAFFALPGIHVDGHRFIPQAIAAGAVAIFCETIPDPLPEAQTAAATAPVYIQVGDCRGAMSSVAARFNRRPSRELAVIGVTGTDGKSTTTWLIDQLLTLQNEESGFVSTVMTKQDIVPQKNEFRQSTPEAPEIQGFLRAMVDNGKTYAVVEATSHGLSSRTSRLKDVDFHVAVFTNITHEHLEFHGSFEQYRSDKAQLFRALDRTAKRVKAPAHRIFGVINLDDPNAYYFRHATRQPVLTYSVENSNADLYADQIVCGPSGSTCVFHWGREARPVEIPLAGRFNVENVLAAVLTTAHILDRNPLDTLETVPLLKPLPGRMHVVSRELPWTPIVDYAHTPGAFSKILPQMRLDTKGRLILVFGSAGERDRDKRAMQGRIAAEHADLIILADEDPRGEDSLSILEEIASGVEQTAPQMKRRQDLFLIPDRREAIAKAVALAQPGDTVMFLGKGHESSIIYADSVLEWDEARVVTEEIAGARGMEKH